jgi:hypothetical protein
MVTNIKADRLDILKCGMPVELYFEDRSEAVSLPQFKVVG